MTTQYVVTTRASAKMTWYMSKAEALNEGFTHNGSYFGIPVYMTLENEPIVAAKFMPFEYLMPIFMHIEGFLGSLMGLEPVFRFKAFGRIDE